MKKNRLFLLLALLLSVGLILAACGTNGEDEEEETDTTNDGAANEGTNEEADTDFTVGMVTDVGGVDDKSFNQSAWEGIKQFGEENGLVEGESYAYAQSSGDADYLPNLNRLTKDGYDLIFSIGFMLAESTGKIAEQNPDTNYSIVDEVVEADNVASIKFKEQQGSFLVGVAAALKSESGKVGFIGGAQSELIKRFEAGFRAGVASVDSAIEVQVQYADSFQDATKGKAIAANMYNSGVDVIYHASGATGNGVFAQAKDIKNSDPDAYVWVIGVDRDQHDEGQIEDMNVTLTSMLKRVDVAVQDIAKRAMNGEFPGGETIEYGLEDNGIDVAKTNEEAYTDEINTAVEDWKQKILDGEVEVPTTDDELQTFLDSL
ncbi:BMP family protein [Radiobacillus sp. PE A8.2]|uniref:BMP family lipoprotein n=1 Tax=Radiobacillus sp. PE A8.2 TaxID=3380349 RepID=UPI003890629A